jgi:uncharacterized protein YlxW (UPF0749 family)
MELILEIGGIKINNMQYIKQILTVFSVGLILFTMYTQNEKITELKKDLVKQQKVVDSLQTKVFQIQTLNGQYEMTLNHLEDVNPKAAKQFQNYLLSETE